MLRCYKTSILFLCIAHVLDIVVILDGGKVIRCFSATIGNLQWEVSGESTQKENAHLAMLQDGSG